MKQLLISAKNVCKSFDRNNADNMVLNQINADIYTGDYTVIMGPSGAGKSTLLYVLSGMDTVTSGSVFYKEQEISRYKEKQMASLRVKNFGFVFQQSNLVSNLTLFENVAVAGYLNKECGGSIVQERATQLLKQMHVENAMHRLPSQVSGGEAQRTAFARAVINKPEIVFADEPTGALNKRNTDDVLNLMTSLNEAGQSILMVTHDVRSALRGNRLLYIEDGKIVGEKEMPPYQPIDARDREAQINAWLASMEW